MLRPLVLSLALLAIVVPMQAADAACASLATRQQQTYGFSPARLSEKEQQAKTAELDAFWTDVKAAGPQGIACVKQLLVENQKDSYFQYDGASLLSDLDPSGASDADIAAALLRTSFDDIQAAGYIDRALRLSHRGYNIGPLALKYLRAEKVDDVLPEHAFTLDRTAGAILLFGSMDPAEADKVLYEAAGVDAHPWERNTAVFVWSLNMTETSFFGIKPLAKDEGLDRDVLNAVRDSLEPRKVDVVKPGKYTREVMLAKLRLLPEGAAEDPVEGAALDNSLYAGLLVEDLDALRDARRRLITDVSPHSIDAYLEMSRVTLNMINVLGAYEVARGLKEPPPPPKPQKKMPPRKPRIGGPPRRI